MINPVNKLPNLQKIDLKLLGKVQKNNKESMEARIVTIQGRGRDIQCNYITKTSISDADFQERITGRIDKRNYEGRKVETVEKESSLKEWEKVEITFAAEEIPAKNLKRIDPLVITVTAERGENIVMKTKSKKWTVDRTLIDTRSGVDVLFYRTFKAMGYEDAEMTHPTYNVHGFNKAITKPKGEIVMRILLGEVVTKITLCD